MKPLLKAPETNRLKLNCDAPPSNFAYKFNLRRYISDDAVVEVAYTLAVLASPIAALVGRCRLTLSNPS
jgi:hypothetical protein